MPPLELSQKAEVVVVEQTQVVETKTEEERPLDAHAEREAADPFRIVVDRAEHIRVDHPAAEDLEPPGPLADTAPGVDAARTELERLGIPASVITVSAEGENAPIVPTAEGVREARNRYVAIVFPEREAPPPAPPPVAAVPAPAPPPTWAVSLGPWYGHNLKETNSGGSPAP